MAHIACPPCCLGVQQVLHPTSMDDARSVPPPTGAMDVDMGTPNNNPSTARDDSASLGVTPASSRRSYNGHTSTIVRRMVTVTQTD
eukprot:894689-Amphidinium_carterae.1